MSLSYSSHDIEQITHATVGLGDINFNGSAANEEQLVGLNRDISKSQELTKSLTVDPINFSANFEWGRSATDNKQQTIVESILTSLGEKYNPVHAAMTNLDGVSSDLKVIWGDMGIKPQTLDVGQDRKFITISEDGTRDKFSLAEYLLDLSRAATKLFSNGIMNNEQEAIKNAKDQVGYDESGRLTILFDPTAAPDVHFMEDPWGNIVGLTKDLGEVSINYLGANVLGGIIQTRGQAVDQQFINAVTNNAKENGGTIILAGHSGGGLRNYLTLVNSTQNQYLDDEGRSVLLVKFSGAPVNYSDIAESAKLSGVGENPAQNKSGDFVGNFLGGNGTVIDAIWSGVNLVSLFELTIKPDLSKIYNNPIGFAQNPRE